MLQLVAALGGLLAGLEHHRARGGALRGLAAGALFATGIVIADTVSSAAPAADVPDPMVLMIVITAVLGALLGALVGPSPPDGRAAAPPLEPRDELGAQPGRPARGQEYALQRK